MQMKPNYEKLNDKNIITVGISSDITISSEQAGKETQITLNKVIAQVGNKLSLSGGKIVVGAGVSHVLVSGSCQMYLLTSNGNAKNFFVYHNKSGFIASINTVERTSKINIQKSLPMQLVSVSEGDTFAFGVYAGTGDVIQNPSARTYVTVQVVD